MTWDQDQVDSFMKSYNWTNFEQKSCRMITSTTPTLLLHSTLLSAYSFFAICIFDKLQINQRHQILAGSMKTIPWQLNLTSATSQTMT